MIDNTLRSEDVTRAALEQAAFLNAMRDFR